ncbi:transcriptional regulator family: Fungal Specific TF, partial [Penicillium tannophilum]
DYGAGFGGGPAEAVTLTAAHTQDNLNWITFCAGVWSQLRHSVHVRFEPTNRAIILRNADFLENPIHHTPERLLAHQFIHGEGQFGEEYLGKDIKYGWDLIVQLAKDDNAQTDATQSKPVQNAGTISFPGILTYTFTYWINGVYLEMCNFRSGGCEDPDQAARTP